MSIDIRELRGKLLYCIKRNSKRHIVEFAKWEKRGTLGGGRSMGFGMEEKRYNVRTRYLCKKREFVVVRTSY